MCWACSTRLLAVASGGLILDFVNNIAGVGSGPRVAYLLGAAYYIVAILLLRPVQEPRRGGSIHRRTRRTTCQASCNRTARIR
jgi:hypothetical protein